MTAPGLFPEPDRVEIPDELAGWTLEQLEAGMVSAHRVGDWEAVHRVMFAMLDHPPYKGNPLAVLLQAVLLAHEPARLYKDCGHLHEEGEDGEAPEETFWVEAFEAYVCEAGYRTTVCRACEFGVDGNCLPDGSWPCPTFKPMADKLVESLAVAR